jgi:hypothetical protein
MRTGAKEIQKLIVNNSQLLSDRNFYLPYQNGRSRLCWQQCYYDLLRNKETNPKKSRDFENSIIAAKKDTIMTCERFYRAERPELISFQKRLADHFQIKIVYFYRYFLDKQYSEWKHYIRITDPKYFNENKVDSFTTFISTKSYQKELKKLDLFQTIFGRTNLIIIDYNRLVAEETTHIFDAMMTAVFGERGNFQFPVKSRSQFESLGSKEYVFRQLWMMFEHYVLFKYDCRVSLKRDYKNYRKQLNFSLSRPIPMTCMDESSFFFESFIRIDIHTLMKYKQNVINYVGDNEFIRGELMRPLPICTFDAIAFQNDFDSYWKDIFELRYRSLSAYGGECLKSE